MKKLLIPVSAAISMMFLFGGCLSLHVGGGKKTTTENKSQSYNVTLGQQLTDLKSAYDSGVISEREYNRERKKLMKDY
jgi:uncharacterized membrane protein